ncbi:type II secretion system F family protein [uncultured Sphingomonas sp.]|uniref:type II secretion system F family protein n=1 Tax=uncultured Sphingomonas sp. TaxID=158754 RepID=UPI0035CAD06F
MSVMSTMLIAIGAFLPLALLALAFSAPSTQRAQARRIAGVRGRHGDVKIVALDTQLRRISATRDTKMDLAFGRILPNPAVLAKRLAMTGKSWTVGRYGAATAGIAVVTAGLAWSQGAPLLLALLLGSFLGIGLPHMVVGMTIGRRVGKFTKKFPDAIELLVRGLRSGLPISETIGVVGHEVPGPVGEEFRGISDKMKIGRSMDMALQETADRLGTPEFQFFTITIAIQRETGGNLAETLANLADVLRKRAQMKLKIKAMSSESKASAYIIGALPFVVFVMIYNINPTYMTQFFIDERLIAIGLGGLVWMAIGAGIMAKMIRFEI